MFGNRRPSRSDNEPSMTSMVDISFLLLIFFVVTAAFQLQKSIATPTAQSDSPSRTTTESPVLIQLHVDEFGGFLLLTEDSQTEAPGKQNLIRELKTAFSHRQHSTLLLKVHPHAKLQSFVDAMDASTIAGCTEIQVAQVEDFS